MIRVLIAEDSSTLRHLIRKILESDREMAVIGEAHNGRQAVELCKQLKPDIMTIDIHMPEMDGFQAIQQIMNENPIPIIVLTNANLASVDFRSFEVGALAIMNTPRPNQLDHPDVLRLITQVKALAGIKVVRRSLWLQQKSSQAKNAAQPAPTPVGVEKKARKNPKLVAIGASTGGPQTLQIILSQLPANYSLPIVVVQHISDGFIDGLAQWLSDTTPHTCKVAGHNEMLRPGIVYFAPQGRQLHVRFPGITWLDSSNPVGGHCPSATALFDSVAINFQQSAIGVLLTGMGEDGARGLLAMHQAGAYTIAQDEATSIVYGMPKAAADLNAAVEILPMDQIAFHITQQTHENDVIKRGQ